MSYFGGFRGGGYKCAHIRQGVAYFGGLNGGLFEGFEGGVTSIN